MRGACGPSRLNPTRKTEYRLVRATASALIWLRRGRGQARETRDPVIERCRIEQADVANAILTWMGARHRLLEAKLGSLTDFIST
jgi:hypothetical protein